MTRGTAPEGPESCDMVDTGYECKPSISQYWGQYSPYFTVPSETSADTPASCQITFAQLLSRHGARDPTAKMTTRYNETIAYVHNNVRDWPAEGKYAFLKHYEYTFGADQLSVFGEQQMVNSGVKFYQRYRALARDIVPFLRASGQKRVVASAENFTQGYHLARSRDHRGRIDSGWPYEVFVLPEGSAYNNTLNHRTCMSFENGTYSTTGDESMEAWADVFVPPITKRLNKKLKRANLTTEHTLHLMDMCPFDTVAHPYGKISPFCKLFDEEEWQQYGYYQSLGKYYGFGFGNPLGATQGVGFANELIARLTDKKVHDHTTTNSTLDNDEATFPLGRTLYADFSHDNDITSVMAALGLYDVGELPKGYMKTPQESLGYTASWTVPFAARMYVEKMVCDKNEEELVRIVVNDRVVPLAKCSADELGRCTLRAFVESLDFAKNGGEWDKC